MNIQSALTILAITLTSCGQNNSTNKILDLATNPEANKKDTFIAEQTDTTKLLTNLTTNYFPFELMEVEGHFQIVAELEGPELYPKYYDFFKKYGYEGNGPCWEGHITQILEKLDKDLLKHITFDAEAGGFFAIADTKNNQIKFVEILSPIFADLKKLDQWIKKANRARIDD